MGLELDWLEREERYRQRVTRLMTVAVILVGALVGTGFYLRSRHVKEARQAAARVAEEQKRDAARRQREQFVADSTAAAERYAGFKSKYDAQPIADLPFLTVPLPPGQPIRPFVDRVWSDYVQAIDPDATPEESTTWFRQNYTEIMNEGPLRGRAILMPKIEQKGTQLEIQRSTFPQITRAQIQVGMREEEVAPADSMAQGGAGSMATEGTPTPAAGDETAAASQGSPDGSASTPPTPPAESGAPAEPAATRPTDAGAPTERAAAPESATTPATAASENAPSPAPAASPGASTPADPVPPEPAPQESVPPAAAAPDSTPHP